VEFSILGPLKVLDGDRELTPGRAKQRALLAMLLLHRNEAVAGERLAAVAAGADAARLRAAALATYERLGAAPHVERVRAAR
jgi:hypothetical protein